MGVWQHKLSNRDFNKMTADCKFCGENINIVQWANIWHCSNARRLHRNGSKYRVKIIANKVSKCERCGLENKDYRFFDLNHRDSNHKNNEDTNIEILCPNCHRLETIELWNSLKGKGF